MYVSLGDFSTTRIKRYMNTRDVDVKCRNCWLENTQIIFQIYAQQYNSDLSDVISMMKQVCTKHTSLLPRARFLSMVEQGLSQWEKLYICNIISGELAKR